MPDNIDNIILAALLSVFHIISGRLKFISRLPRSVWLSIAGGVSTAYVFLHLIPELAAGEELFDSNLTYLLALAGLVTFYGLEKFVQEGKKKFAVDDGTFWVHMASYLVYNFIIGYILIVEFHGAELYLFALAMAFHFLVNDFGLRHHHQHLYHDKGRWLISAGIAGGAVVALLTEILHHIISGGISFIAGAVIMNALKEELPEERENKYWAFLLGIIVYAAILMIWDTLKRQQAA